MFQVKNGDGTTFLVTRSESALRGLKAPLEAVAFWAVVSEQWPEGLVPLFPVEKKTAFELRRLPGRGQENFTEPLFFALPPEHEPQATNIAGRWTCTATNTQGSKHYLAWELAVDGERVAGRFDQQTDYRFGFIAGGTFRSNRIELNIEYMIDRYQIIGEWRSGKLAGKWRRTDDYDYGTWEGTRPSHPVVWPKVENLMPLYEWQHTTNSARRYSVEVDLRESGWLRSARPLCLVWSKPGK